MTNVTETGRDGLKIKTLMEGKVSTRLAMVTEHDGF